MNLLTKTAAVTSVVLAFAVQFPATAFAQSRTAPTVNDTFGHGMMWGYGQWGGFGMVLGPIFMVLILVGIVGGVVYLFRSLGGGAGGSGERDSVSRAIEILNERYARGEIDAGEYEERKKRLLG